MSAVPSSHAHHGGMDVYEHGSAGISNGLLGMIFFLCSELALFSSLIFGYLYIRQGHSPWPPHGDEMFPVLLATWNTIVLITSGVVMHQAQQRLKRGDRSGMLRLTLITIILGVIFLSGQVYEYTHLNDSLTRDTYGATFFTLTGLHGLHVTGGVVFLIIIWLRTRAGAFTAKRHFGVEAATLYWHFVDVVWVVLYALFYLAG